MFNKRVLNWYLKNKRDLPWRTSKNPYYIWLSEIILQQTKITQGLPYFLKFKEAFPTVLDLANADEGSILKLWQGLGYYSRARNLHYSAKYIINDLDGKFPDSYNSLLKLKGVGDYTASAIASICYNEATAVVDGNVYRVLARYFGIHTPINTTNGIKEFKKLAQKLIDSSNPGTYNQAIMDFGAIQCKPQNPLCNSCPLNDSCIALQTTSIKDLPVKENKIKVKKRHFNYLVITNENNETILEKRKGKGIWEGLYQFPLIETLKETHEKELIEHDFFKSRFNKNAFIKLFNSQQIIHKLSHQHLYTRFWLIHTSEINEEFISWNNIWEYPVPTLIHNFLENYLKDKV